MTLNRAGKVVMLDTSDPAAPKLLTGCFLNEDDFGKVHAEGDHKVHVARVSRNRLTLDRRFRLDMDSAVPGGPARPHGVAFR